MARGRMAAVLAGIVVLSACTSSEPTPPASTSTVTGSASCRQDMSIDSLPVWARAGFTPPDQAVRHVRGRGGDIVGVLFGWPLSAPPAPDHQNKILWVARTSPDEPLHIQAHLTGSTVEVSRSVPDGPGPSIVDLPRAGCWRLVLTWGSRQDEVYVHYGRPRDDS